MQHPVKIEFHGFPPSDAITDKLTRRVEHLNKLYPKIIDGRVVVELAHHHRKGQIFRVHVEMNVPGERLVISHEPGDEHTHFDVYVTIRDAFDAMERILQAYAQKMRRDTKRHEAPLTEGRVYRLFPNEGFGFITTSDDREVFFDANAVVDEMFESLMVGSPVRFCEEDGEKGPQATTVHR